MWRRRSRRATNSRDPRSSTTRSARLWYRGLVTRKVDAEQPNAFPVGYPSIDDELTAALRTNGAHRMVIAHTPRLAGIVISHGGRWSVSIPAFRAIMAASSAIWKSGGTKSCLTILTAHRPQRRLAEMARARIAAMLAALVMAGTASAQTAPKPLFASNEIIHLTIRGPIGQIARSAEQRDAARRGPDRFRVQLRRPSRSS